MNAALMSDLAAIEELNARYIEALDSQDMQAWLATFMQEPAASYICTTAESEQAGLRIAIILDDCYARLQDRVTFVTRIWAGTYQEYRTRHFVQRTFWRQSGPGAYELRSNFNIAYTHSDTKLTDTFIAGRYVDRVRIADNRAWLLQRKAVVDGSMLPRYVTYPL